MDNALSQHFILNSNLLDNERADAFKVALNLFKNQKDNDLTEIFDPKVDTIYLKKIAALIKARYKDLVIIGTGASSIIPKILFSLSAHQKNILQTHFLEDTDTFKFKKVISQLTPKTTCFLVISKSGRTIEVLTLLSLCLEWMSTNLGKKDLGKHFYFITQPINGNYVLETAKDIKSVVIEHPNVSGRYAFFSCVGLLPATLANFNIDVILNHSKKYLSNFPTEKSWIMDGITYLQTMSKKYPNIVLMTYCSAFNGLSLWFRQLIAESLGKAGKGINPIIFEGNIDQHSQLQSYLDGLDDKFFVLLTPNFKIDEEVRLKSSCTESLSSLKGKTLSDINRLQISSLVSLLKNAGKNIRVIEINTINEELVAELSFCFMLETILYAKLNNIDPFTQTAVDEMKNLVMSTS